MRTQPRIDLSELDFRPIPGEVDTLYSTVGLRYQERILDPAVEEAVKAVTAMKKFSGTALTIDAVVRKGKASETMIATRRAGRSKTLFEDVIPSPPGGRWPTRWSAEADPTWASDRLRTNAPMGTRSPCTFGGASGAQCTTARRVTEGLCAAMRADRAGLESHTEDAAFSHADGFVIRRTQTETPHQSDESDIR